MYPWIKLMNEQCPISEERVGETAVRLVAAQVLLLTIAAFATSSPLVPAVLLADFGLRAFFSGRLSPLKAIAAAGVGFFRLSNKPVNAAPKVFAARIGFLMSAAILLSEIAGAGWLAQSLLVVLALCAGLESIFSFCVGCVVYTFWVRVFPVRGASKTA